MGSRRQFVGAVFVLGVLFVFFWASIKLLGLDFDVVFVGFSSVWF